MANKEQTAQAGEAKKKGGMGRKLLVLLLFVLLLGGGAGAYLLIYGDKFGNGTDDADSAAEAEPEPVEIVDPIFVKIGPMTINIGSRLGSRLLYTSMMLKVKDETTEKFLLAQMPDINNRLLILLSQQTAEELNAAGGKEVVAQRILEALERPFSDPQPTLTIESVLFQDFIVQ